MKEEALTKEQRKAIRAFESVAGLPVPECDLDGFLRRADELGEKCNLFIATATREEVQRLGGGVRGKKRAARNVKRILRRAGRLKQRHQSE